MSYRTRFRTPFSFKKWPKPTIHRATVRRLGSLRERVRTRVCSRVCPSRSINQPAILRRAIDCKNAWLGRSGDDVRPPLGDLEPCN